jgi:hypothetical protein
MKLLKLCRSSSPETVTFIVRSIQITYLVSEHFLFLPTPKVPEIKLGSFSKKRLWMFLWGLGWSAGLEGKNNPDIITPFGNEKPLHILHL